MKRVLLNDDSGRALIIQVEEEAELVSFMTENGYVRAFLSGASFGMKLINGELIKFPCFPWKYRDDSIETFKVGARIRWEQKIKGSLIPFTLSKNGVIMEVNYTIHAYEVEDNIGKIHIVPFADAKLGGMLC